jgi:transposase InsO family protein
VDKHWFLPYDGQSKVTATMTFESGLCPVGRRSGSYSSWRLESECRVGRLGAHRYARGAPFHPQTQGKIERLHQTLKNRVLLENYFLPGDLERQIDAFIEHYNHRRTLHSPGHG